MSQNHFEALREAPIPTLNIAVQEFRHQLTGARHFHLPSKDNNNAFLVAFPTVPQDSTGVAHILEHTTLCGSRRYPVRDPFFMMIRRSLNTFMNAFTASDWTAYPFASQNRKDFDNLLQVYLDAVFFPNLAELDFAQEGHRVEFEEPDNPETDLVYKGVVYNEMKGAMSAPSSQLWQHLQSALFPTTTYHHNSGGDPERIPDLTWQQLKHFHSEHYHPSNAVFMTYGSFPVEDHQCMMHELALQSFEQASFSWEIPDEQRYANPLDVRKAYALDDEDDLSGKSYVLLGWLLGNSADLHATMQAELLSGVLLDNSASPLRMALETTELGSAPSELCGLDDSSRECAFVCGLEGSDPEHADAVEQLILGVLEDVARDGVPAEQIESVLHQLELNQREVGGGRFPYGLQLMVRALPAVLHGGDAVGVLNIDPVLSELRESIKDPEFIKSLARKLLLNNPHRVRMVMAPDSMLAEQTIARETTRLAKMKAALDNNGKSRVVETAAALKQRQESEDDQEILPKVGLGDVPVELEIPSPSLRNGAGAGLPTTWFAQGTNGLVYQQIVIELPELSLELTEALPLFCDCLAEVGCGNRDYLATQRLQASVTGGISAHTTVRASIDDVQKVRGVLVLSGKSLIRNQAALTDLLNETLDSARFDELPRLRELIAQLRAYRENQVTDNGHGLALSAASAGLNPCGALAHYWDGLEGIRKFKMLDDSLQKDAALEALAGKLEQLRETIKQAPRQLLVVSEESEQDNIEAVLKSRATKHEAVSTARGFSFTSTGNLIKQAWETNTQVNYCARAYPTVPQSHQDAPALTVLGPFLRNGYLHRTIREQGGAYGSGASYNPDTSGFRFFSYRDPRLAATLIDFDASIDWLLSERHQASSLEEAILGVIGEIDRPGSPAGEAIGTFFSTLHGRTPEQRRAYRQQILGVSMDDLKRVGQEYLQPASASTAVVGSSTTLREGLELGLELEKL